ncbi:hypothetical protein LVB77_18740 [Lysobacter sp. 5GHs7-4]|uniref:hypothetical protein n=1 Tax=Lysobacter sp. 5GHs7-4 TaxID=2904253 RepID=UPI001E367B81|nr:hypothetical protein [Lysobacter sp. 5GHs7-4]UHQ22661.1 hypothetical protein LVB77_18740 [Lysobacter sp. 5GHs7-4]
MDGRRRIAAIRVSIVFLLSCALLGCATSIHRTSSPWGYKAHILSIDAKQRNVISAVGAPSAVDGRLYRRFCSEPPPDVFTALATSLSAEAEASFTAKKADAVSTALRHTLSENAATIERTQTVNILREAMFRNCERYLSGAVSTDEFIVQAARDQRAMVHILAIEQITGVARAQSTALTTLAKATDTGTTEETIKLLDAARQREADAKKASATAAKAAYDQTPEGDCASAPKAPNDKVTEAQLKDKKAKCDAADTAADAHKQATAYQATLAAALQRQGDALVTAWGSASSAQQQGLAANKDIAQVVLEIVKQSDNFNEIEMACVVRFRNGPTSGGADQGFYDACKGLVEQLVLTRKAELKSEEAEYLALQQKAEGDTRSWVGALWTYFAQGKSLNAATLDALTQKAGVKLPKERRRQILVAKTVDDFEKQIRRIDPGLVRLLVNATQ